MRWKPTTREKIQRQKVNKNINTHLCRDYEEKIFKWASFEWNSLEKDKVNERTKNIEINRREKRFLLIKSAKRWLLLIKSAKRWLFLIKSAKRWLFLIKSAKRSLLLIKSPKRWLLLIKSVKNVYEIGKTVALIVEMTKKCRIKWENPFKSNRSAKRVIKCIEF